MKINAFTLREAAKQGIDPFALAAPIHAERGETAMWSLCTMQSMGWQYVLAGRATLYMGTTGKLWFAFSEEALAEVRRDHPAQANAPHPYVTGKKVLRI